MNTLDTKTLTERGYVTATQAGKHFGYTKDYMLMLAKAGKIDGRKAGHKWFIHLKTAEDYFRKAARVKEVRRQKLRKARKSELRVRTGRTTTSARRARTTRTAVSARIAILETCVIVFLGVSIGTLGYMGTEENKAATSASDTTFLQSLAISFYELLTPGSSDQADSPSYAPSAMHTSATPPPASPSVDDEESSDQLSSHTFLSATATVESVKQSFSDEVEVTLDPRQPDVAIVKPHFRGVEEEPYRFILVPMEIKVAQ